MINSKLIILSWFIIFAANATSQTYDKYSPFSIHKNIQFSEGSEQLTLDLFIPASLSEPTPCIVVIQGGGFRPQDGQRFVPFAEYIATRGFVAALISYRGSPQHQYQITISDVKEAVSFIRKVSSKYNIDPDRIGAMGRSAGATLTVLLAVTSDVGKFGDMDSDYSGKIQAAVGYAGVYDFVSRFSDSLQISLQPNVNQRIESSTKWIGSPFGLSDRNWINASAINHVNKNTPPILLLHCKNDSTVPWIQSKIMYEELQRKGVESSIIYYDNGGHDFSKMENPEEPKEAMIYFFKMHLHLQ